MKALLIAGGFGTRLRPLTLTRPKHLLPIAGRPHIEHVLDHLRAHDVQDVVLLTSYLADAFGDVIALAEDRGTRVEVAHEAEPLGTAGALKNAEHLIGTETFLALNGDVLTSADLSSLIAFHRAKDAAGTILLTPVDDPSAFGVVPTDAEGRVERFVEKPPPGTVDTNLINAGVYVLEPEVLGSIPEGEVVSIEREVFPDLAKAGRLFATSTDEYWMDIGTPEKYIQANLDALDGESFVHPTARVAGGARVSSSCIGAGCVIEAGASITEAVLLDNVQVGEGSQITRCALGEGVKVASHASILGATVGDGEKIEA